jgi:signal transduction histidine kinase
VDLPDRLAAVAAEAAPLRVSTSFFSATKTVPATAVDRIADCAAEALRNVARHAGTDTAELRVRDGNGQVVVEIIDQGRGFDARSVPRSRRGISESIQGRMAEIGGTAEISGAPGAGTTVTLRWPSDGTAGTQRSPGPGTAAAARGPG